MNRLAVLEIESGDFEQGFVVSLQIFNYGTPLSNKIRGKLPGNSNLEGFYTCWQENFSRLKSLRSQDDDWQVEPIPNNRSIIESESIEACRTFLESSEASIQKWLDPASDIGWVRIRERLAIEFNNPSDPIQVQVVLSSEHPLLWKIYWYVWDLLENRTDIGISFILPNYHQQEAPSISIVQKNKVRILAILGDDRNINLQPDWQEINKLKDQGAEVVLVKKPSGQQLIEKLTDRQGWHILFFAGHSDTKKDKEKIYINETESLAIAQFKNALKEARKYGLQIAIFNSCKGLGLATKLSALQIPVIIVMQDVVPDIVAQFFLKEFLQEYVGGEALHTAVRRSQDRLEKFTYLPGATWLPAIFQNAPIPAPTWEELRLGNHALQYEPPVKKNRRIYPSKSKKFDFKTVLILSLFATIVVMGLRFLGVIESLELIAYDYLMSHRPEEAIDNRLLVIEVTDLDIEKEKNGYPVADITLAKAIEIIEQGKPRAIGLDMHRSQPREPGHKEFISQFKQNLNLFTVCKYESQDDPRIKPPSEFFKEKLNQKLGFSNLLNDRGNGRMVRRQLLSYDASIANKSGCPTPYAFSFLLAYTFLESEKKPLSVTTENTRNGEWQYVSKDKKERVLFKQLARRTGGYQTMLYGKDETIMLNYRSREKPALYFSLENVLNGEVDPIKIKDRIVLIGYTAAIAKDNFDTIYKKNMAGVWVHTHMISQMLSAILDDPRRSLLWCLPQWNDIQWGDTIWVWSWSLVAGLLVWRWRSLLGLICGIATWLLWQVCLIILTQGGWMPLVPSLLSLVITSGLIICVSSTRKK